MKMPVLLMIVVGVALLGGAAGSQLGRPEPPGVADEGAESRRMTSLLERLESIEREQTALRESVESLALSGAGSRAAAIGASDIEAAVGRYLDEHAAQPLAGAAPESKASAAEEAVVDPQALVNQLLEAGLEHEERQALFDRARAAGVLDQLVALFEQRARDNPHDAQAQVDFGAACIQKIFEVGEGPAAGLWASKADSAYDAALAVDERHWDARFSKAVALSFWPPIFGKQAEAIGQLQTLIAQQADQPPQPHFVQSYLALGNLYLQSGKLDQAQAVFAAGLALFPDDAELQAKLAH